MGRVLSSSHVLAGPAAAIESPNTQIQVQKSCPDVTSTDVGNSCIGIAEQPALHTGCPQPRSSGDDDNKSLGTRSMIEQMATTKGDMAGQAGSDERRMKPIQQPANVAVESSGCRLNAPVAPMEAPLPQGALSTVGVAQGHPVQEMRAPIRIPSESDYNSATAAAGEAAAKPPKLPLMETSVHAATTNPAPGAQVISERLQISSPADSDNTCTAGRPHQAHDKTDLVKAADNAKEETLQEESEEGAPPEGPTTRRVTRSVTAARGGSVQPEMEAGNESPLANSRKKRQRASPSVVSANVKSKRVRKAPSP